MKSVVDYFWIVQESKYISTMNCVFLDNDFLDIWWNFNFNWSPCLDEGSEHHKWANELLALIRSKLWETTRWYNIQSTRGDDDDQNLPNTQCFWSIKSCRRQDSHHITAILSGVGGERRRLCYIILSSITVDKLMSTLRQVIDIITKALSSSDYPARALRALGLLLADGAP